MRLLCVPAVRDAHAALRDVAASDAEAKKHWDDAAEILR
jgi:hypothetical protein